jgi:large subunit ribosomal protein L13
MKTYSPKPKDIQRSWYVVDAEDAVLGRLASEVAQILRGKHKPTYAPHMDVGDHVIVVNAAKIRLTGQKADQKVYRHHSGYPGGLREVPFERMVSRRPERVVERAVRGMLPHTRLGRQMAKKLAVYAGADHPHEAQQPAPLKLGDVPSRREES